MGNGDDRGDSDADKCVHGEANAEHRTEFDVEMSLLLFNDDLQLQEVMRTV